MFKLISKAHITLMLVLLLGVGLLAAATACGEAEPAPTPEPVDVAAITSAVQEAVRQSAPESGPSAAEIQTMIEKAVMDAPSGASTAEIQALIATAVADIPSGASTQEIQTLVTNAIAGIPSGPTTAEIQALVTAAVANAPTGASAKEVQDLVEKAIMDAPTGATAEEVRALVDKAVADAIAASAPAKETIWFADLNWGSARMQNAIAKFIVEHGYGYPVDGIEGGTIPLWVGLLNGDLDVFLEVWLPNHQEKWDDALEQGTVIPLGKSLDDNWQSAYVVPTYVVEQNPGLVSVQDLRDHMAVFPQEGGKLVLWNCLSNWSCSGVNTLQAEAYGLDDILELKDPGTQAGLFASLTGAYEKGEPWLGYLWGPTQPDAELDLTRLEEPTCQAGQGPGDGCGYPTALIRIAAHPTLVQRAPEIVEFFRKWDFSADINVAADAYKSVSEATFDEVAIWFLKNHEAAWTKWVPADVASTVRAALPE